MWPAQLFRVALGLGAASALFLPVGCGGSPTANRVCPGLPCAAGANVHVALTAETASKGKHTFLIDVDGVRRTCELEHVDSSQRADAKCVGGASLMFGPTMRTREITVPGTTLSGYGEEPVPGRFGFRVTVGGTPATIRISHDFEGKRVSDHTVKPIYKDHAPNGPGCPPVCAVAEESVM